MTIKRELREAREQLKALQAEHELVRLHLMWKKLMVLAQRSGDRELLDDIAWHLEKMKFYAVRHDKADRAADKARRAKAKILDADYDRHAPTAKSKKDLAAVLGVHPVTLSKYEGRRFGKIS